MPSNLFRYFPLIEVGLHLRENGKKTLDAKMEGYPRIELDLTTSQAVALPIC